MKTQFFTLPVTGGTPRQISNIPAEKRAFQGEWIDNNTIVFSANLNEDSDYNTNNTELYILDIISGKHEAITDRDGPDFSPKVSNDRSLIAYLGYDDKYLSYQQSSIYVMRRDGSDKYKIEMDLDRNISNIYWSGNDKRIALDIESIIKNDILGDKTTLNALKFDKSKCPDNTKINQSCLKYFLELKIPLITRSRKLPG